MPAWNTRLEAPHLDSEIITVMLAGMKNATAVWQPFFRDDNRFRVTSIAMTAADLLVKLAAHPDLLLIDAQIFDGPEALIQACAQIETPAYIILPALQSEEIAGMKAQLDPYPMIKGVYEVDVHLATLSEKMFGDARVEKMRPSSTWQAGAASKPVSTRIVTVWNLMGGVGKTTISGNLAYEAAMRGYKTLLIGMGAPCDLGLTLKDIKSVPNLAQWETQPTRDGLAQLIQEVGPLHVIAGFRDISMAIRALNVAEPSPGSFTGLISAAIRAEYAVIVIDAPPDHQAISALAPSNNLVLVTRPDEGSVYRTAEAYKLVFERLRAEHSITETNSYLVVNRIDERRMSVETWYKKMLAYLGGNFLPITASIQENVEVGIVQDRQAMPVQAVESFRQALLPLADQLFARPNDSADGHKKGRVIKLGKKLKLRV